MDPHISPAEIRHLIQVRAHALWEADGRPEDAAEKHWLAAEAEVLQEVDRSGATGPVDGGAAAHDLRSGTHPAGRQDDLLDEAIEETFPASDPISPKQIT